MFVPLKERPPCDLCGPSSLKRALFQHLASKQVLCARCAFIVHGAAAIAARLALHAGRRPELIIDVVETAARV